MDKNYRIRLFIGSILFGFIVFGNELFIKNRWNWSGLLWVSYGAIGFGVLFNIVFKFMIKDIEKKDKKDEK